MVEVGRLEGSVRAAVGAMSWLAPSDQATVELAFVYARTIDDAQGDLSDRLKALYLGPHLLAALRALGGAPGDRRELAGVEEVGGKLAALRALHGRG